MSNLASFPIWQWMAVAFLLATSAANAQTPLPPTRPNIIFILADDLGYGDLSCYGQQNFRTPNIDRMAAEGMRFMQHYAGSTVCAPSRACLLTGQHTGHVYQRSLGNIAFRDDPQDITIARVLKNAGYATAMIGKSGLTAEPQTIHQPNAKGFDHFFGFVNHGDARHYYPEFLWRDGKQVPYPGNHIREGTTYSGDVLLTDTLAWLESNKDRPFFLQLAFQQPHLDLAVPAKWKEPFVGRWKETPYAANPLYRGESQPKATFAGMIAYLDDSVGRVLSRVRELGIADRTVVFFASDNGAMNEFGWSSDTFKSSGNLRGAKRELYEGGIRVPFIAWWPKTIAAGQTSQHVSAFWDFASTACELAGIPAPADTDGISYLPTLLGQREKQRQHDYLYWEYYELAGVQAARQDDWKAVRLNMLVNPNRPFELYNLATDPGETQNVAAEHPDVIATMKNIMRGAHRDVDRFKIVPPR